MNALIRCVLHLSDSDMEFLENDMDKWHKAWGQVKYYLEIVHQVEFR